MPVEPANSTVKPEWMTLIESRKQRADYFFQTVLENQREWYSRPGYTRSGICFLPCRL